VLVRAGIDRRATEAEIGRAGGELTSTVPAGASWMNQVVVISGCPAGPPRVA